MTSRVVIIAKPKVKELITAECLKYYKQFREPIQLRYLSPKFAALTRHYTDTFGEFLDEMVNEKLLHKLGTKKGRTLILPKEVLVYRDVDYVDAKGKIWRNVDPIMIMPLDYDKYVKMENKAKSYVATEQMQDTDFYFATEALWQAFSRGSARLPETKA